MTLQPHPSASPKHILVAERSATVALAIAGWLRAAGHQVETARTAPAAQAVLLAAPFDLLIVDAGLALDTDLPRLTLQSAGAHVTGRSLTRPVLRAALLEAVAAAFSPATPSAAGPDHAAIAELWGAPDSPAFRRIAAVFLAEAPVRLAAIVAAHAAGDRARLSHEAHALAGAALNVGLPEVVRLARALEHAPADCAPATLATDLHALRHVAAHDFPALHALANPA